VTTTARRLLTAYVYTSDQLDRDLRRRLLAWAILHKYSNFTAWLQRRPEPASPALASLADRWFATGWARPTQPLVLTEISLSPSPEGASPEIFATSPFKWPDAPLLFRAGLDEVPAFLDW
jgi:hypothetical protein